MKLAITVIFAACLQLALSPVCFCGGMNGADEEVSSCCHRETTSSPHSKSEDCPHCSGEDDIQLSIPLQNGFTPELTLVELPPFESTGTQAAIHPSEFESAGKVFPNPPPVFEHSSRAVLGVFVV